VVRRPRIVVPVVIWAIVAALAWVAMGLSSGSSRHTGAVGAPTVAASVPIPVSIPTTTTAPPVYEPPPVTPVVTPAQPGEGQWTAVDTWDAGPPSVLTTTFRPDPTQPTIVAYATWIRTSTTQFALYPGTTRPRPPPLGRGPEMVPPAAYPDLLATFNSGFYEADGAAGFYTNGTLYYPMINGLATVVSYADGLVDIVDWQGGPTPGPDVVTARQNLPLLVDDGAVTPSAGNGSAWGLTLHGAPAIWRTGLGIDANGNLMYVAAPAQTAVSLGRILVEMGAVRGMELDINPEWPIFVTYSGPGATGPTLFVPNPNQVADRFLYPSTKDFFAVFRRVPGVTAPPW
jgi:hypothetical protein